MIDKSAFTFKLGMDLKMARETSMGLHEHCSLVCDEVSGGIHGTSFGFLAPRQGWVFNCLFVFWQLLANVIANRISTSPERDKNKSKNPKKSSAQNRADGNTAVRRPEELINHRPAISLGMECVAVCVAAGVGEGKRGVEECLGDHLVFRGNGGRIGRHQ